MTGYQAVPISLVGGSNETRTRSISSERTLNMYPELVPSGSYPSVLYPWPGTASLPTAGNQGVARGSYTHESTGEIYKVIDTSLYKVGEYGAETLIGEISGTGLVLFESLYDSVVTPGAKLLITTSIKGYVYDITNDSLSAVTDASYTAGGSVASVSTFVIWQLADNQYGVADVGTPSSLQAENISTVAKVSDHLVRIIRFKEVIYMMGASSIEPHYVGSSGTNPLVGIQNGTMPVGLISRVAQPLTTVISIGLVRIKYCIGPMLINNKALQHPQRLKT